MTPLAHILDDFRRSSDILSLANSLLLTLKALSTLVFLDHGDQVNVRVQKFSRRETSEKKLSSGHKTAGQGLAFLLKF